MIVPPAASADDPERDRPVEAAPPDEALREGRAEDEAADDEAEGERVRQPRQAVDALQHEGRARDEGEEPAIGERGQRHIDPIGAVWRRSAEAAQDRRKRELVPATGRGCVSGSRKKTTHASAKAQTGRSPRRSSASRKHSCRTPPNIGRDRRHQAHDRAHAGQFPPGARRPLEVAHDGPAEHDRVPRRRAPGRSARRSSASIVGREGAGKRSRE